MAKRKPKFWNDFEKFLGSGYPKFIKTILLSSGFDNKSSLLLIDKERVKDIEEYVSKNRYLLKKTSYEKNTETFEFSIGHKVLLTNIPKYIKQFEKQSVAQLEEKKKLELELRKETEVNSLVNTDPTVSKNVLLQKLRSYSKATKFNFEISEKNIENFAKTDQGFNCQVLCPHCPKKYLISFKRYWNTSNFTNHIRTHFKFDVVDVETSVETINDDLPNGSTDSVSAGANLGANRNIIRLQELQNLPSDLQSILE